MRKQRLVKLGASGQALPWSVAPDWAFQVLGAVQQGLEFGYLAVSPAGNYLQINGTMLRMLKGVQVRAAIRRAESVQHGLQSKAALRLFRLPSPTIVARKRSRVLLESEGIA